MKDWGEDLKEKDRYFNSSQLLKKQGGGGKGGASVS